MLGCGEAKCAYKSCWEPQSEPKDVLRFILSVKGLHNYNLEEGAVNSVAYRGLVSVNIKHLYRNIHYCPSNRQHANLLWIFRMHTTISTNSYPSYFLVSKMMLLCDLDFKIVTYVPYVYPSVDRFELFVMRMIVTLVHSEFMRILLYAYLNLSS